MEKWGAGSIADPTTNRSNARTYESCAPDDCCAIALRWPGASPPFFLPLHATAGGGAARTSLSVAACTNSAARVAAVKATIDPDARKSEADDEKEEREGEQGAGHAPENRDAGARSVRAMGEDAERGADQRKGGDDAAGARAEQRSKRSHRHHQRRSPAPCAREFPTTARAPAPARESRAAADGA